MEKTELFRLTSLLKQCINKAEICTSRLRNGFLDDADFRDAERTVKRLDTELGEIQIEIEEKLDLGEQ